VEKVTCRLLPFSQADGPHNMAADEVLLQSAQSGQASLRFYAWTEATVSLGYFQASATRESDPKLLALPFVRRATGGSTLVHHHELTYALALPEPCRIGEPWLVRMHRIIGSALHRLGIACRSASKQEKGHSVLCFQQVTPGDLLLAGSKIAGSAQRRQKSCLLQHGAVLLKASPHAPQLPGILEQTGRDLSLEECQAAIVQDFRMDTGWEMGAHPWGRQEEELIAQLVVEKYCCAQWNDKR
jgi:lipoyl(octanoyl) transferase